MIQSARTHIASLFQRGAIDQLLKISLDVVFEVLMQHESCLVKDDASQRSSVKHKDQVDDIKEETNSSSLELAHASEAQICTRLPELELSYQKLTDEKLTSRDAFAIVNSRGVEESWRTYGKHTEDQAIKLPTLLEGQEQRSSPMETWRGSSQNTELDPEQIAKEARAAANAPKSFDERLCRVPKQYANTARERRKIRQAQQQ